MSKKGHRVFSALLCQECKSEGRTTETVVATTNKHNTPFADLPLRSKFCSRCRKHTDHKFKETK